MDKSAPHYHRGALRRRSSPARIMPSLVQRAECADCPSLAPCPVCPKGQMCQLQVPATCQQCPTNACVALPVDHGSKTSMMGGAIGGILGVLALAAVLLWVWRKRLERAKEEASRVRADAKQRTASGEKFRIGTGKATAVAGATGKGNGYYSEGQANAGAAGLVRARSAACQEKESEDIDDPDSEDIEWTELREDGLTAFRQPPGIRRADETEPDGENDRRRSIGAATHLSRITEGAEDDEDDERLREALRRSAMRGTIVEEDETERGLPAARALRQSQTSIDRLRTHSKISARGMNPFSDGNEARPEHYTTQSSSFEEGSAQMDSIASSKAERASSVSRWSTSLPESPSPVHRPTGAPVIDLFGKPRSPRSDHTLSGPKALSPLPQAQSMTTPARPLRDASLNLRLEDGVEPGRIGEDIRGRRNPFADGIGSQDKHTSSDSEAAQENDQVGDLPLQVQGSPAYLRYGDKKPSSSHRASVMTASSFGTLDYVMSAPRIVASDGPKRVQVQAGGKAQLVRSLSAVRREKEASAAAAARSDCDSKSSAGELSHDPFTDVNGRVFLDRSGASSPVGTFGPQDFRRDSDTSFGNINAQDISGRFRGSVDTLAANMNSHAAAFRTSNLSAASLPFVDQRPIGEPVDRSPTDANPRDSISVGSTMDGAARRRSGLAVQRASSASSLLHAPRDNTTHDATARQSGVSIGGLSVLDDIPFQIPGSSSPASQNASSSSGVSRMNVEMQMPLDAQAKIEESKRRLEEQEHQQGQGQSSLQPLRSGTQPAFDEIRLRHELDNYPFSVKGQSGTVGLP